MEVRKEERKPNVNPVINFMKTQKHFHILLNCIFYIKTYIKNNFEHLNKRRGKFKKKKKGGKRNRE